MNGPGDLGAGSPRIAKRQRLPCGQPDTLVRHRLPTGAASRRTAWVVRSAEEGQPDLALGAIPVGVHQYDGLRGPQLQLAIDYGQRGVGWDQSREHVAAAVAWTTVAVPQRSSAGRMPRRAANRSSSLPAPVSMMARPDVAWG